VLLVTGICRRSIKVDPLHLCVGKYAVYGYSLIFGNICHSFRIGFSLFLATRVKGSYSVSLFDSFVLADQVAEVYVVASQNLNFLDVVEIIYS
jgi:hypothetical protein